MTAARQCWLALALFVGGVAVGAGGVLGWQALTRPASLPLSHLQATIYLPTQDNQRQPFPEDQWSEAIRQLVAEFGGATVGAEHDGWWQDGQQNLYREPVRLVVVTFPRERQADFTKAVRRVGACLGQEAIYYRLEEVRIELLEGLQK